VVVFSAGGDGGRRSPEQKVRYADVARVDCRVTRVSKAMKTYDEMLNDRR
jgi:hypothetical protein